MPANDFKETLIEYFAIEGRITRETYILRVIGRWIAQFVFVLSIIFLEIILSLIFTVLNLENSGLEGGISLIFIPIVFFSILVFFVFAIIQEMKRLHDMNSSGWGIIFGFIPLVNIIYYLLLILSDGTVGPNEYGEDPKGR
jgi:Predicted membrane protein